MTGSIGLLGTRPSYDLMEGCDTLLMVGSSFPYSEWLPEPGKARGVQIDLDARLIGTRYPMEVNLVGDAAETLRALIPLLERKEDRSWREEIEDGVDALVEGARGAGADPGRPDQPAARLPRAQPAAARRRDPDRRHRLGHRLVGAAPEGPRPGWTRSSAGRWPRWGRASPTRLAAKFAFPDRPVIAVVGDGAMQMLGMNALIDIAHYAERGWPDQRIVICVLDNRDLNQVTWEQRVMSGDPKLDASQILPAFDYAGYARLLGLHGEQVETPEEVGPAWDRALAAGRPAVVVVPHRPRGPAAAAAHHASSRPRRSRHAIAKGDPAAPRFMKQSLRGKLAELLTR